MRDNFYTSISWGCSSCDTGQLSACVTNWCFVSPMFFFLSRHRAFCRNRRSGKSGNRKCLRICHQWNFNRRVVNCVSWWTADIWTSCEQMRDNPDTSICLECSCNVCGSSWHLLLQTHPIDSLSQCRKIHSCATGCGTVDTCAFGVRFCKQAPIVVDLCCKKSRFLAPSLECVRHKDPQLLDCQLMWCRSVFEEHASEDKSCTTTPPLCTHSRS